MPAPRKLPYRPPVTVGCLFAAIGGFARGFIECGAAVLWANEKDNFASATFKENLKDMSHFHKPVEKLSVAGDQLEPVDVLTAGFPCQPFSIAGEKRGFKDERGLLFMEIIRIIKEFGKDKPKFLLLENVKNLRSHDGGQTFKKIQCEIQRAGYWFSDADAKVLNSSDFGIPQNRERIFMVAASQLHFSNNPFVFPEIDASFEGLRVRELLDLGHKPDDCFYFKPGSRYYGLFKEAIESGGKAEVYQLRRNYVRKNMSSMCFTLMANMGEGGHNTPVIKDRWGIRKLTPRECARLQGYQDDWLKFPLGMSNSQLYKQIGNSVTVPVIMKLATGIIAILRPSQLKVAA